MLTMLWTISLTDVKMTKNLEVTIFLILYCSTVIWLRWIFSVFAFSKAVKRKLKCFMFSTFTDEASIYFNLNQEMKKNCLGFMCFGYSDHIFCLLFRYLKEDSKGRWQCITTCWHSWTSVGTYSDVGIGQYKTHAYTLFLPFSPTVYVT